MTPAFAVVGHPNKGKSSIVSTIAQDDSVAISAQSGTTSVVQRLSVEVGSSGYVLYDTPGFQRPTRVLQWLQAHADSADQRREAVAQFLRDDRCREQFPDEVMLLTPIMEGAAILYVVDGSRPYGPEYESEMEILRWTGQASMALINPIENDSHVEAWKQALGQYFKVVRVFNAVQADFEKLLSILEAFSHIREEWRGEMESLIKAYRQQHQKQLEEAVSVLSSLLIELCTCQVTQKVLTREQAEQIKPLLAQQHEDKMRALERRHHDRLKAIYRYVNLPHSVAELPTQEDLFDTEKWVVWGLNQRQLIVAAGMAGAATGAAMDLALAGSSLMVGALSGGVIGAAGAWLGAERLADFSLQGLSMGAYLARQGPIRNRNFPYVVISRYLFLFDALQQRTHANRTHLEIGEGELQSRLNNLSRTDQQRLHSALDRLSRQQPADKLKAVLRPLLQTS